MMNKIIGDLLRERMEENGFNTITLANASGYSQSYISKLLNGGVKKISYDILDKVLSPMQLTVSDFFMEIEKKKTRLISPLLPPNLYNGECRLPSR